MKASDPNFFKDTGVMGCSFLMLYMQKEQESLNFSLLVVICKYNSSELIVQSISKSSNVLCYQGYREHVLSISLAARTLVVLLISL